MMEVWTSTASAVRATPFTGLAHPSGRGLGGWEVSPRRSAAAEAARLIPATYRMDRAWIWLRPSDPRRAGRILRPPWSLLIPVCLATGTPFGLYEHELDHVSLCILTL